MLKLSKLLSNNGISVLSYRTLIVQLSVLLISSIAVWVGFYNSIAVLMVIGLLIIGLFFINILKRFNFKLLAILLTFTYVPAVALLWPLVHHFHLQIVDNSAYRLESMARNQVAFVENWLEQKKNDIILIENSINITSINEDNIIQEENILKIRNVLLQIKNSSSMYNELFILDQSKCVMVSTDQSKEKGFNSDLKDITLDNKPIFSKVFLDSDKPVIILSKKINNQNFVIGIKYNLSELHKANELIHNIGRPESTVKVSLVNEDGYCIFASDMSIKESMKYKISKNLGEYLNSISNMKLNYKNSEDAKTIGSYSRVNSTGWFVVSEQSFKEVIYNVDKNSMNVFVIMIINFIAVLIFAPFFSKGVTNPIHKIRDIAIKGAEGDLSVQIDKGKPSIFEYREAKQTVEAFNKMISTLYILKNSLESKIEEKTQMAKQLMESNEELNAQQEELTCLTDIMTKTNEDLTTAYKELKNTQTKLVQNEKMASLGLLVAGVAHEINNPLGAINSNISIYSSLISKLEQKVGKDDEEKQIVDQLKAVNIISSMAVERILEIVKSLRSFARLDEAEYKEANINDGIESTLVLLKHRIKNKIKVVKDLGKLPNILCYPNQLNQVFMNVIANAIDAIKNEGTISIKTIVDNKNVCIMISDNGMGINTEHLQKIFDPGFTTKGVGVGTGLGLSIVYNIIETHKGKIDVISKEGLGTEIIIKLPIQ